MTENWLERWAIGRTGWHEPDGNQNLKSYWQWSGKRVLVPLCGKTSDLLWLESRGNDVVGVELSEIAVLAFFEESGLKYEREDGPLVAFRCISRNLTMYCGDFFAFRDESFDAHYDRAAFVAIAPEVRERYAEHTSSLLTDEASQFVLTVAYDDSVCEGPPFSVAPEELLSYWPRLKEHARVDDTENAPPKFLRAGLEQMHEVVWIS